MLARRRESDIGSTQFNYRSGAHHPSTNTDVKMGQSDIPMVGREMSARAISSRTCNVFCPKRDFETCRWDRENVAGDAAE